MAKILLIEDEPELSQVIYEWLTEDHYIVEQSFDGKDALSRLSSGQHDLAILDLMLPSMNGLEICRRYRDSGGTVPILILTAKKSLATKEDGLDSGADDYLTKPFKLRELSARVRALLRRPAKLMPAVLTAKDVSLDVTKRRVTRGGQPINLLPKEFALLELLMSSAGEVLSTEVLIKKLWSEDSSISPDTIRSHLRSLRKKLEDHDENALIQTVHGVGYKIERSE